MLGYNLHRFLFECWDVGRQHNATKKKSTRILELEDLSLEPESVSSKESDFSRSQTF